MTEVAVGDVGTVLADVQGLARTLIAAGAAEVDRESRFLAEQLSALGQAGAAGLMVPRDGVGAGLRALARACGRKSFVTSGNAIAGIPVP